MTERQLLVVGHGFVEDRPDTHPAVDHASRLQGADRFDAVNAACLNGTPTLDTQLDSVTTDRLVVVPLFVSDGYFTNRVVPEQVDSHGPDATTVAYTEPVGTHEGLTDVIRRRIFAALPGDGVVSKDGVRNAAMDGDEHDTEDGVWDETVDGDGHTMEDSENVGVAVIGHGSQQSSANRACIQEHTDRLRNQLPFTQIRSYFVEEEPTPAQVPEDFDTAQVIAVPVFVAPGTHVTEDIPNQVGFTDDGGTDQGTQITYTDPVGTDPLVAGLVYERALDALPPHGEQFAERGGSSRVTADWRPEL